MYVRASRVSLWLRSQHVLRGMRGHPAGAWWRLPGVPHADPRDCRAWPADWERGHVRQSNLKSRGRICSEAVHQSALNARAGMALMTAKEATLTAIAFVQPSNAFGTSALCVCLLAVNG
mmetsp:Transcript_51505/g.142554  ORF Transcript_51505/g.142554 Transcript_51505/m.142554 type:complete len:119 (+) Transcript_51505:1023-1379(+)